MFWQTKYGLDGDALLSWSPTARPLTRMPLNRVRWMDCYLDQAGGPTTTPTKTPADSNSQMPVNTQTCTLTQADAHTHPSSKESVYSCKVKHGKKRAQLSSRQMTWDVGGLIIFPAEGLKPCCCRLLTTGLLLCSPLFMVLSTLKEHLPPHCLDVGVKMSAGVRSCERWDDSYRKRET